MYLSCKQKSIPTASSTDVELVGVDNAMNFVMRVYLFIAVQVATIPEASVIKRLGNDTIIQQDNASNIKLAVNGKWSSTKPNRYIDTKYVSCD